MTMRLFKVYDADEDDHQLVLAKHPAQAAEIASTVWAEIGTPQPQVHMVEMQLPDSEVGLIYEPNTTPIVYRRSKTPA
jgi:hypothetical protein